MPYYPIKCPYCLKDNKNEDVLFKLPGITISEHTLTGLGAAGGGGPSGLAMTEEDDDDEGGLVSSPDNSAQDSSGAKSLPASGYITLAQLDTYEDVNVELEYRTVKIPYGFEGEWHDNEVVMGVTLEILSGNKVRTVKLTERFCTCEHKLHRLSGLFPSYVAFLMGTSNAGKTMYLTALYHSFCEGAGLNLTRRYNFSDDCNVTMQVVSESAADTSLENLSYELFEYGRLPGTTIELNNEPLIMQVTVTFGDDSDKSQVSALLFICDVPGESLATNANEQNIAIIANRFGNYDAFMIMLDPTTLNPQVFTTATDADGVVITQREKQRQQRAQLTGLMRNTTNNFTMGQPVKKPAAILLTKGDLFYDEENFNRLKALNVTLSNPALSRQQHNAIDGVFFNETDDGSKRILENLNVAVRNFVRDTFDVSYCSIVSALGRDGKINIVNNSDGSYVDNHNIIKSWNVNSTALWLLMSLNILPPFHLMSTRVTPGEKRPETKARDDNNIRLLNEWGYKYCADWHEVTVRKGNNI